jgi:hypothetical protein
MRGSLGAGLLLALLPWLHLKNALPMTVFTGALVATEVRRQPIPSAIRRVAWITCPLLCSLGALAYYNVLALGRIAGPYSGSDAVGATVQQATMIFLGLYLDQAQGLFLQQPFLLLGLLGLPVFVRRTPFVACTVIAAYLAVLVPNCFHQCWYGCWSISGRFRWSVAAL